MLSREEVQHIARLARIGLTEAEETRFQQELVGVFGLIEELKAAKVDAVDTGATERETNRTREDEAEERGMAAGIRKNFPVEKDGFNKVRAVF